MDQPAERVQDLWFEDGNLVIQAGNSQYRVYRGVLAMHSPIFQDMLSLPQPPDSELVEGCPLVRLTDSEEEVTSFLKAIFHPIFFMPFPAPTEIHIIIGCLRLSHKYGVDYLRRRALVHLSSGYRTKLSELDAMAYIDDSDGSLVSFEMRSWPWAKQWAYIIAAIDVAREVDAPWILPCAFYDLATLYPGFFVGDVQHGVVYNGLSIKLSASDQIAFLQGHMKQVVSSTVDILRFLTHPRRIDGCASPLECTSERMEALDYNAGNLEANICLPLQLWDSDDWEWLKELCPVCLPTLKKTHQDARQAFWDKLPELYNLLPWEELERLKVAAIGTSLFR
ncbi:hypothetical protein K438DRAFT_1964008 [Mycena galopus ATCC 62051]|nr:hypothetical protein K438DRAFT_1964008 [Mycena galopus ATCC 62051]